MSVLNDEPGTVHVRSKYTYNNAVSDDVLSAHTIFIGREGRLHWHPGYTKTWVTRKAMKDRKSVQLGALSVW